MSFQVNDRVRVVSGGFLKGRIATVLGTERGDKVRIKVTVKLPEVSPVWTHDYWAVSADRLELVDVVTELGELAL